MRNSDELWSAAHVHEVAEAGEAVARDVADGGVQAGQRAAGGILPGQPDRQRPHQAHRAARAVVVVDAGPDQAGVGGVRQHG
jgi:hypothetical protein